MSLERDSPPDVLADSVDPRVVDQYSLTPTEAAALVSAWVKQPRLHSPPSMMI